MKRLTKLYRTNILVVCMALCFLCTLPAHASESLYDTDALYRDIQNMVPENGMASLSDLVQKSERAHTVLSPENVFSFGLTTLKEALLSVLSIFKPLLAVVILAALAGIFQKNLGSFGDMTDKAFLVCAIFLTLQAISPILTMVEGYITGICTFLSSLPATMSVFLVSGGKAGTAAVNAASAAFSVSLTQLCARGVIFPCVRIIIVLSVVGSLAKDIDLSGIINFLRSFCAWGLGVLFALFGGVHSATLQIASGTDSLALRGIRFTAARLIPVAGNMLSESMRTVLEGIRVLKNAFGGLGIAYILAVMLPVICTVLALKFAILIVSFLSKLMGTKTLTAFFDGVGASLNVLIAILLFASVSGILILAVFMQISHGV